VKDPVAVPSLAGVARVLADACGISLEGGLDPALRQGLVAAAAAHGVASGEMARRIVARDPDAVAALVEHSVVCETAFWRHPEQLAAVGRIAAAAARPLRVWSAGCATGEEPYSVAIALLEAGRGGRGDRIVATDVSERALAVARAAAYGARALRKLPPDVAARWLEPGPPPRVAPAARALVTIARQNLVTDPPPPGGPFDLVLCRNVLIYFAPPTAVRVLERLAGALAHGGTLFLGPVELPIPLAASLGLEWVEESGATLLRRPA
jgi:chemotaxis protein methyltransferase CheR